MKKIIVAVDGSELSNKALDRAIVEATRHGAEVLCVNVVEGLTFLAYKREEIPDAWEHLMREPKKLLAEAAKRAEGAGVTIRTLAEAGRPAETIAKLARQEKADEIIVGSRGKNALDNMLLGSVSGRLVQIAPCTIVVVR